MDLLVTAGSGSGSGSGSASADAVSLERHQNCFKVLVQPVASAAGANHGRRPPGLIGGNLGRPKNGHHVI